MSPCESCPLLAHDGPTPAQAKAARVAARRAAYIAEAAQKVRAAQSWIAAGFAHPSPFMDMAQARAFMVEVAAALETEWGKDAVNELRATLKQEGRE